MLVYRPSLHSFPASARHSAGAGLPRLEYRADIDGLRGIAVLAVVLFHAFPANSPGGFTGVDIFFVISGYLISQVILQGLRRGTFHFSEFYIRRVKRIFPALLLVMATVLVLGWALLLTSEFSELGKHVAGGAVFISNLILWNEHGYFESAAAAKPLLHLWSLAIEEQFYLVWPLILWTAWKMRWNIQAIIWVILSSSFFINVRYIDDYPIATFYLPASRFWELMLGSGLGYLSIFRGDLSNGIARPILLQGFDRVAVIIGRPILVNSLAVIGVVLVALGFAVLSSASTYPGVHALLPTLGAALIMAAGPGAWFNRAVLSTRLLVWLGLISYPLYLWHWPLLSLARITEGESPSVALASALLAISLVLAWLTYAFVERPIRRGIRGGATAVSLFGSLLVVGCAGCLAVAWDGVPDRPIVRHLDQANAQIVGPLWQYSSNDTCLKRYALEEARQYEWWFCITNKDASPTLLLLGNSFANQLYPGLAGNAVLGRHAILNVGTCDPVWHMKMPLVPPSPCSGERQSHQYEFINGVIAKSGTLRYVIVDGLIATSDPQYIAELRTRIDFIEKYGAKVILFVPHLLLSYDVTACISRLWFIAARGCEIDQAQRETINEQFRHVTNSLMSTNPELRVFDQNELLCQEASCYATQDGIPLFRDQWHLSEYGSIRLALIFERWAAVNAPDLLQ